jgi:hypothetical protein
VKYRSFEDAREYVRELGLTSSMYWSWSASGDRPSDIPSNPSRTYKRTGGWTTWTDFLGVGSESSGFGFKSFKKARIYIRKLNIRTHAEYVAWSRSGKKTY